MTVGRPAFSEDGREAVFWLDGPGLTETLSGLIRVKKEDSVWRFVEFSFDQDWWPVKIFEKSGLEPL